MRNVSNLIESKCGDLIISKLESHGYNAFYVGGCVRDAIMKNQINDYDITTNCLPNDILKIFSDFKTFDAGLKHGTVSILVNNEVFEVTTFRKDGEYTDYRRPNEVFFCEDLLSDLSRRDFTCNALAFNKNQGIIDNFGGFYDINKKVIRAVGNPDKRFNEDALRILRAIRFCSKLGFKVEEQTKVSIFKNKELLNKISNERIFSELKGILLGTNCVYALTQFKGVLETVILSIANFSDKDFAVIAKAISKAKNMSVKLAILLSNLHGKKIGETLKILKCDNKTIFEVEKILELKNFKLEANDIEIKWFLNKSQQLYELCFEYHNAIYFANADSKKIKILKECKILADNVIKNGECYLLCHLAIKGDYLETLGIKGKDIGKTLNLLLKAVITNSVINERFALDEYLKTNLL